MHQVENAKCEEGWCGGGFPFPCKCGGLVHADLDDEDGDGISLYKKCDKCGDEYEFADEDVSDTAEDPYPSSPFGGDISLQTLNVSGTAEEVKV